MLEKKIETEAVVYVYIYIYQCNYIGFKKFQPKANSFNDKLRLMRLNKRKKKKVELHIVSKTGKIKNFAT